MIIMKKATVRGQKERNSEKEEVYARICRECKEKKWRMSIKVKRCRKDKEYRQQVCEVDMQR
jgi:hypothetical protein